MDANPLPGLGPTFHRHSPSRCSPPDAPLISRSLQDPSSPPPSSNLLKLPADVDPCPTEFINGEDENNLPCRQHSNTLLGLLASSATEGPGIMDDETANKFHNGRDNEIATGCSGKHGSADKSLLDDFEELNQFVEQNMEGPRSTYVTKLIQNEFSCFDQMSFPKANSETLTMSKTDPEGTFATAGGDSALGSGEACRETNETRGNDLLSASTNNSAPENEILPECDTKEKGASDGANKPLNGISRLKNVLRHKQWHELHEGVATAQVPGETSLEREGTGLGQAGIDVWPHVTNPLDNDVGRKAPNVGRSSMNGFDGFGVGRDETLENLIEPVVDGAPKKCPSKDRTGKVPNAFGQRSSAFRGVTRHRWTGRYEAHLWDNSCRKLGQHKKGRQVYLGGYDREEDAARAYDLAALKYWGPGTLINFPLSDYAKELEAMHHISRQEYIASLRRKSSGFARGASKYRGVTRHHQHGRWEARIGRVLGNKYLYLGTYSTQEEAAEAYDIAAVKYRGLNAVTNFELSRYITGLKTPYDIESAAAAEKAQQAQMPQIMGQQKRMAEQPPASGQQSFLRQVKQHKQESASVEMPNSWKYFNPWKFPALSVPECFPPTPKSITRLTPENVCAGKIDGTTSTGLHASANDDGKGIQPNENASNYADDLLPMYNFMQSGLQQEGCSNSPGCAGIEVHGNGLLAPMGYSLPISVPYAPQPLLTAHSGGNPHSMQHLPMFAVWSDNNSSAGFT